MKRNETAPAIITPGVPGSYEPMQRLAKSHREFDEKFLQELLADHPELLPIREMRDDIGQLVLIGREVPVESGFIDNLYLSTEGCPVVVETKLWRNPESRREVLSQTLDYIKDLISKDYAWFADRWSDGGSRRGGEETLLDALNAVAEDLIEEEFIVDRVHRFLSRGEVVAMIVGDGIQSRLKELVDHLCKETPHLQYALGLVEVACYKIPNASDGELLVVPRVSQQIEPVERASVRIDIAEGLVGKISVSPTVAADSSKSTKARVTLSEEEFLQSVEAEAGQECRQKIYGFYSDLLESFDCFVDFKTSSLMIKMSPHTDDHKGVSVLGFSKNGRIYNTGFFKMIKKWGIRQAEVDAIAATYWGELHAIDPRFELKGMGKMSIFIPFDDQIIERLPQLKECVGKVILACRKAYEEVVEGA
jgi:hypothetical protein